MKGIYLLTCFVWITIGCFSQGSYMSVMIGKTEAEVREFLQGLNSKSNNPNLKIEQSVTERGDLLLTNGFPLSDEQKFNCIDVLFLFQRVKGTELCIKQIVTGSLSNVQGNLAYIKDNFVSVADNKWKRPFADSSTLKIVANFEKKSDDFYGILYYLE